MLSNRLVLSSRQIYPLTQIQTTHLSQIKAKFIMLGQSECMTGDGRGYHNVMSGDGEPECDERRWGARM